MKIRSVLFVICFGLAIGSGAAQDAGGGRGRGARGPQQPLDISGNWTGTWSNYNPNQTSAQPNVVCAKLDAKVVNANGVWEATFEGDCGRPYKYTIKMEGRQTGNAVLFKGTVDLGAADGGVYDWIGRATSTEFFGFYTNAFSTGVFTLKRAN
jgi:hypothetical protein